MARHGLRAGVGDAWAKNESGEPIRFPVSRVRSFEPWQRPRDVASGARRKSGAVIRPTYACQVESFLLPSAHYLHTPLDEDSQVPIGTSTPDASAANLCPDSAGPQPSRRRADPAGGTSALHGNLSWRNGEPWPKTRLLLKEGFTASFTKWTIPAGRSSSV